MELRLRALRKDNADASGKMLFPETHDARSMTTLVEQLSRYATSVWCGDLPSEIVHQAKPLIIDTVGCGLGGDGSAPARDTAGRVRSSEGVSLIGRGERATFANGVMIRFLDFNDGYTSTGESGHPSDSIVAVLTTAELRRRNGRDAIAATLRPLEKPHDAGTW
jgi:2-methylcitrate dehydratase